MEFEHLESISYTRNTYMPHLIIIAVIYNDFGNIYGIMIDCNLLIR